MKLNPEVYRLAAERIFNRRNSFCCPAISNSARIIHGHESFSDFLRYKDMAINEFNIFKPSQRDRELFWFGGTTPKNQIARQLALLLMAEIVGEE